MNARIVAARGMRGFVDGLVSVVLAGHLALAGFSSVEIGAIATATLLGSALLTLLVGLAGSRFTPRSVLLCRLRADDRDGPRLRERGIVRAAPRDRVRRDAEPDRGRRLASSCRPSRRCCGREDDVRARTSLFARYNLAGALFGAAGALASGLPELAVSRFGVALPAALRSVFVIYALCGVALLVLYAGLERDAESPAAATRAAPLARSRRVVLKLSALFSLDSFGGGFAVQSLVALWLFQRFELSLAQAGTFFFGRRAAVAALSQLVSPLLARRGSG